MSVRDDSNDFAQTGLTGVLHELMRTSDHGYVRVLADGWRGELVSQRPVAGTGPFVEFQRGTGLTLHHNTPDDTRVEEYRLPRV